MEKDGTLSVFSRNSENMSGKYPDLVQQIPNVRLPCPASPLHVLPTDRVRSFAQCVKEGTTDFVLDCEAVAWDAVDKVLLPFSEITKRKRKDVKAEDIKIKVHLFAFDLLYLNGEVRSLSRDLSLPSA